MTLSVTEAIVLHAFDYLESSRIIRLLTRESGVQSVLARGARKSRGRYGSALDLFAEGTAQVYVKPNRELQNLGSFEVTRSREELAHDVGRFTAASTVAELALRFAGEESSHLLYDTVVDVLDRISRSPPEGTLEDGLAGCWRIVAVLGFTPELSSCSLCHTLRADERSQPPPARRSETGWRARNRRPFPSRKPARTSVYSANSSART
jgi:DNA repair protein RecO (recombination protein O)